MPRDPELDALHAQVQQAFEAKQAKFEELKIARTEANAAYASLQQIRNSHDEAFAEMKRLRDELNESSRNYDLVWSEYSRLKESLSSRIDDLKAEADDEHRMMSECFDQASHEYNYGDRALASSYSQDGHAHKANRDALNAEVSNLFQQLKSAREDAQWRAPKTDSSEYQAAKARFEQTKALLDEAKRTFDAACDRRDLLQAAFNSLNEEHKTLKAEFERKLAEVKIKNARERERVLDRAGVYGSERGDAKVVKKSDGTVQVYFGGFASGDGLGHGHVAIGKEGKVTYKRQAFSKHGRQNYVDSDVNANGIYEGTFNGRPAIIKVSDSGNSNQMQVFYGGDGAPDGPGHNHINVINGRLQYWREDGKEIYRDGKDGRLNNL